MADEGTTQYRCPITGQCSPRKIHRRCAQCKDKLHCWDCCGNGGSIADSCKQAGCPEPSMDSIDYDMP